jgi:YEATS domain-containing protein 4
LLKLFEVDPVSRAIITKKSLSSECYDELVFNEPSALMQSLLNNTRPLTLSFYGHDTDFEAKKGKVCDTLLGAKRRVRQEIQELREKLRGAQEAITGYREALKSVEDPVQEQA